MNKIKSIKSYILGENGEELIKNTHEELDQNGNVTLLQHFDYDGNLEGKSEYEFDEKGRVVVERQYSTTDVPDQTLEIEYNESGKAHQVTVTFADGSVSYKKYSRDEAERSTTIDIIDEDGETEGKEYRKFDGEDRVLEETIYTDTGAIETKVEYEYNEHGDIVESVKVDEEGFETVLFYDYYRDDHSRINKLEVLNEKEVIIRVDEFEHDERGNRTKHTMRDLDRGSVFVDQRVFDLNNKEIKFERRMGDRPIEVKETTYTIDGLIETQEVRTNEGVTNYRFEYELY